MIGLRKTGCQAATGPGTRVAGRAGQQAWHYQRRIIGEGRLFVLFREPAKLPLNLHEMLPHRLSRPVAITRADPFEDCGVRGNGAGNSTRIVNGGQSAGT